MIDYKYADLFKTDNVDKQFKIATDDNSVVITNVELHSEQFELNESICSDSELRFGSCEASSIKFKMSNVFTSLKDKWITVSAILNGNADEPFIFGRYKVDSDKPTADKRYRDIVAYDAMYDILSTDVAEWYNSLTFPMPLRTFRNAFISHFNLEEVEISLPNDEMVVEKTIEPTELSGKDVITAICEINGCFGHINRNGKFAYIVLQEIFSGIYPSDTLYPSNTLYPQEPSFAHNISKSKYISATYEDYVSQKISQLQIRQQENDVGTTVGNGDNCYVVEDNFLVYGKTSEQLNAIAENLYNAINKVHYRPYNVSAIGNPCIEVGDAIRLSTKYQMVESYVLKRTIKGIQGLKDAYSASGKENYDGNVNSVQKSIVQLKGKSNTLERTIEETKSIIADVEKGLTTKILQNEKLIELEAARATEAEGQLSGRISVTADLISAEVTRATEAEGQLSGRISLTESSFTAEISSLDGRFSKLEQTVDGFTFTDESGSTKISGDKITTGTLIGVTALFTEHHSLFWACGTDNKEEARNIAEWGCDSNAIFAHDANGNRSIEIDRLTGNGVFYGDAIVIDGARIISLIDTYDLADGAKALANTNQQNITSVKGSISSINTSISEMESDISANAKNIATHDTHIGNLIQTIPGLDARITNNASEISDIKSGSGGSSVLASQISSLLGRVGALEDIVFGVE